MRTNRRDFLKTAGAVGAIAAASGAVTGTGTQAAHAATGRGPRGMARGLTLLTMRRNGELRLGVKTDHGVLDAKEAASLLKMAGPAP